MISRNTIDKVFETARVEEVLGEFVQLKKSGSNFKGLSPFSEERTPSFMVSPVKQIWKDFSTGKGGNAVTFLMEHEHYSYPEAIRYLAKKYNIEIEETEQTDEQKHQADERESMFLVSEFARDYFHKLLTEDEQGKAITVAEPEHFCRSCHDYAAVTIDCFQCHASRPEVKDEMNMNAMPEGHQEMIEKQAKDESADKVEKSQ